MNCKAVIFDFDGVIVDSEVLFVRSLGAYFRSIGVPDDPAVLKRVTGLPPAAIIDRMRELSESRGYSREDMERGLMEMYRNMMAVNTVQPMPGVQEFYDLLKKRGIASALGTSRGRENVLEYIADVGLHMDFDVIVTHEDVTHSKPDPETFLTAAKRLAKLGIQKEEIVILEDSENGIKAGKASGIFTIAFKGSEVEQVTHEADIELYSYPEVTEFLFGKQE